MNSESLSAKRRDKISELQGRLGCCLSEIKELKSELAKLRADAELGRLVRAFLSTPGNELINVKNEITGISNGYKAIICGKYRDAFADTPEAALRMALGEAST